MKIAVHAKALTEKTIGGIGYYTYNLLKAIAEIDKTNSYILFANKPYVHKIDSPSFEHRYVKYPKFWSYFGLPIELNKEKFDLLFMPKEMIPPFSPKTVMMVYDLGLHYYSKSISLHAKIHYYLSKYIHMKRAQRIIAISKDTKKDIVEIAGINPEKISVIYPGCDFKLFRKITDTELIEKTKVKYGISGKYIINTSSLSWFRKNLTGVLNAFADCVKKHKIEHKLVITGSKGNQFNKLETLIKELGIADKVVFSGYVETEDIPVLLSGSNVFVFPSLFEGFGLSLLEAMACGCAVVTSNTSAMPEVIGDAGIMIDPANINEMSNAIYKLITDENLKKTLSSKAVERAKLFTWEKAARETLKIFNEIVNN
ncbi:MAG: glycosyltransferase family 4 protein [Elusimicrobia bacterium]|nr:glycosyltransferase family 4 protein [Candidatus Liberimonas magnetica]